jgi:glutaredoxin
MKITVFGKSQCAICQTTKNKLAHIIQKWNYNNVVRLDFVDMETVDGMAEGAYYDVIKVPTTVIEKDGATITKWEGEIPNSEEVKNHFESVLEKV